MTIFTPDGTEVSEIVLPDGSTASEVVAPDGTTVFGGIPDSGDLHARYDFSEEDGSLPIADQTGNGHDLDSGSYSGVSGSINGVQAGVFDGAGDVVYETESTIGQPFHVFAAFEFQTASGSSGTVFMYDSAALDNVGFGVRTNSAEYRIASGGSTLNGGAADTNPHVASGLHDSTTVLRVDGSQNVSGSTGSSGLDGLALGELWSGDKHAHVHIGEVLVYPMDKTSKQSDIEQYLADKWGVTI